MKNDKLIIKQKSYSLSGDVAVNMKVHYDITGGHIDLYFDAWKAFLLSAGFHPDTVDEAFKRFSEDN